jgi:hypothetical protein
MHDRLGRAALRFAVSQLRRRYRRQIRIGAALLVAAAGIAVYRASREVPEG